MSVSTATFRNVFILMMAMLITVPVFGQVEEDELEPIEETVTCLPDTLATNYDKYRNPETTMNDIRQWYSFGSEYFKNKDYKSALPYLWKVYLNDSTKYARNAIRKLADSYFTMQQADSTLLTCYIGLKQFPDQIRLHYYAGFLQQKLGKAECAIPHYLALVADKPDNQEYLKTLSFLYFKTENEKAIEIQNKLVSLDPANSEYQNTLAQYGEHFYGQGGGLNAYYEAWKNDPENIEFAFKYGKSAYEAGEYQKAIEPLTKVTQKDPKNLKAFEYLAMSYESKENYKTAISNYKKIVAEDPKNAKIMCAIATDYRFINDFSGARYWVRKALNAKPGFGLAHITMGEVYESAVLKCQKNRSRKYDDGLVYGLAKREYEKAMKDPAYISTARKRINGVKPFLPTQEEKFMNQNRSNIKIKCYSWIK